VPRSCLLIDLGTGIVSEKAQMNIGRSQIGVGHIGNFIYVVGGQNFSDGIVRLTERYDIARNEWKVMPY